MAHTQPETIGQLYQLYYERHALVNMRCPKNVFYWAKVHGTRWFDTPIANLTRGEIQQWADEIGVSSKSAANRAVHQLAAIINWGIRREYCQEPNPCRWVDRHREKSRERFLQPEEVEAFKNVLDNQSAVCRDFFWMLLYTGARKGNVLAMRWDHISFATTSWTIPGDIHKNDTSHVIALGDPALEILRRRKESATSEWVFPGRAPGSHYTEPKRVWKTILRKAGIANMRIHDLRRTVGSYMAISGVSLPIIGKALGHKDQRSTAVYARLDLNSVRGALNKVYCMYEDNFVTPMRGAAETNQVLEFAPRLTTAPTESDQLDPFLQTIIEGKILTCIYEGRPTKSAFHQKMRGRIAINASQLEAVLAGLEHRKIIVKTLKPTSLGGSSFEYRLFRETESDAVSTSEQTA